MELEKSICFGFCGIYFTEVSHCTQEYYGGSIKLDRPLGKHRDIPRLMNVVIKIGKKV